MATFHDVKHSVVNMDFDPTRNMLMTVGSDKVLKVSHRALLLKSSPRILSNLLLHFSKFVFRSFQLWDVSTLLS